MAVNPIRLLRNYVSGVRPPTSKLDGEPYVNFADGQLGVINNVGAAVDLIGARFFSTTASYAIGATVNNGGQLYQSLVAITPGAWNPAQWARYVAVGTKTNDNALAGAVGEYVFASVASPGVSAASLTNVTITGISLTAGDWDVQGNASFTGVANAVIFWAWVASGAFPGQGSLGLGMASAPTPGIGGITIPTGEQRFSLAATTTVNLMGQISYPSGAATLFGQIRARRVR